MRLLLPTIVHGQAFRKITSMFYSVPFRWGLDSYQTQDSVRISSDTTFSAEIQEYASELKRQGSLGSWANTSLSARCLLILTTRYIGGEKHGQI